MNRQLSSRELELLSSYLDGQLSQADAARIEARINADPEFHSLYEGMRHSRALLRRLPARRAPRNFRLTPKMVGVKPPLPRSFPFFRLASVLASVLFFLGYAVNLSTPMAATTRTVQQFPYGVGGGNAPFASEEMAAEPTESLEETPSAKIFPPETTQSTNDSTATLDATTMALATSAADTANDPDPNMDLYSTEIIAPVPQPITLPVPPVWLFGLLGLAVASGAGAFIVRIKADREWSKANATRLSKLAPKDIFLIAVVAVVVLLLAAGVYWMSTATFYAPFP